MMEKAKSDTLQNNVKEQDNKESNSKLVEQKEVEGTPFTAMKYQEKWYLTLGRYRLTEGMESEEKVIEDATRADWYRVMQVMNIMLDEREERNKINKPKQ